MSANEAAELTRAIVADIRRVVDKADITRQAVELMRSGVPEDAAFYWAVPVAYALQAATKRAGAAPLDEADLETLREALAIGSISWNGDGWYASELGYDYDAAEATMAAASAILARLTEGADR